MKRLLFLLFPLLLAAHPAHPAGPRPVEVVASFSILADMAREVGGPDVQVIALVGPEQDSHTFQPSPDQVKAISKADIILVNGLKFEGWMSRLIRASGTKAKLLVASAGITPRLLNNPVSGDEGEVTADPHAWQNVRNARRYIRNIAAALIEERPEASERIRKRLANYDAKLAALDVEMRETFAKIPDRERKVITNHDAFGYFGDAYGVTFLAPVGISTQAEPSASDAARLIKQIQREKVSTVFIENATDPRLIEQVAQDAGAHIGGKLYADALSAPDGEAPTYLAMMRHNFELILKAMK